MSPDELGAPDDGASTEPRDVVRLDGTARREARDTVVVEEPLEIRVNGEKLVVTLRTPGHDRELAAGFLCSEGVVARADHVLALSLGRDGDAGVVDARLAPGCDASRARRSAVSASSCGACGKPDAASLHVRFAPIRRDTDPTTFPRELLFSLPAAMRRAQASFEQTGGLHAAALFDARGVLVAIREDVGRHNAVDKVIGRALLRGELPLAGHMLMVSGRAGFEIAQKAAVAGLPLLAAVSAASSLAIDVAELAGVTLVGFLRPPGACVYTHPWRVI